MLVYRSGDLLADDAEALVDPVNCVGVAGAGLARAFRERFVSLDGLYREACGSGVLRPGRCVPVPSGDGRTVILFPSKRHWRDRSDPGDVIAGLGSLAGLVSGFSSVALPQVGCGLGGLDLEAVVRPAVVALLGDLPCEVRFYAPEPPGGLPRVGLPRVGLPRVDARRPAGRGLVSAASLYGCVVCGVAAVAVGVVDEVGVVGGEVVGFCGAHVADGGGVVGGRWVFAPPAFSVSRREPVGWPVSRFVVPSSVAAAAVAAVVVVASGRLPAGVAGAGTPRSGPVAAAFGSSVVSPTSTVTSTVTPSPPAAPAAAPAVAPPPPATTTPPPATTTTAVDQAAVLEYAAALAAVEARDARAARANFGADPGRVAAIVAAIDFDWEARLPGWQVRFEPGRPGLQGLTSFDTRIIATYVRSDLSDATLAFATAHELGHAVDAVYLTDAERAEWAAARGVPPGTPWKWEWTGGSEGDYDMPAGDFAEVFAYALTGNAAEFRSRVAGLPGPAALDLLARIAS